MNDGRLVAIGEALIDFIPSRTGCGFDEVDSFFPAVGGAPANVCAVFSRLGGRSLFLTQLGDDPFGHKILNTLNEAGIDTSYVALTDKANTALAFVSLAPDGNRTFSFYRKPSADMLYTPDQIDGAAFEDIYALHFCSVSLGDFPMKDAHYRAIELAKQNGAIVSFDPNLRFMLWDDKDALRMAVNEFIPKTDVLKISDDELEFITGEKSVEYALPLLFSKGIRLLLFTCGSEGMKAYTKNCSASAKAPQVTAVDTTGAGDASIGSFLWKLKDMGYNDSNLDEISAEDLEKALEFAVKYCAISVQAKGAIPSYPSIEEL
ncbi:MAG: carbohydrate kinase [Clostridiales bacterium]|nr:carbohydrate kinase [Clostridiales bacterium]